MRPLIDGKISDRGLWRDKASSRLVKSSSSRLDTYGRKRLLPAGKAQAWLMLTAVLLATPANAYREIGAGVTSCGAWTSDRRLGPGSPVAVADEQWVLGFLSAVPYASTQPMDPLRGVDAEAVWGWFDNYCLAHPLDAIAGAANQFVIYHPR